MDLAIQIYVLMTLTLAPKYTLMRKCWLIHLNYNSTYQRWRNKSAINSGLRAKLLLRNTKRLPVSSLTTTQRSVYG